MNSRGYKMTITAPTLDTITGNTVMVKMRELIKQMTAFAKEVADLVNTIPTDIQDTYSREEVDDMIDELDTAISTLSDSVYPKSEVYTKNDVYNKTETDVLVNPKANAKDVYTKSEVYTKNETDALVNPKANANNVYTKSEVYTKTETDTLIFPKANSSDVYNKAEINNLLSEKQNELTAGTGISINNNVISASISGANIIALEVSNLNNPNSAPLMDNLQVGDMVFVNFTANYNNYNIVFLYNNKYTTMTIISNENPGNNRKYMDVLLQSDGESPINYRRFEFDITTVNVNDNTYNTVRQTITAMTGYIIRSA